MLQPLLVSSSYDPFFRQKSAALDKSLQAAADMAVSLNSLLKEQQDEVASAGCGVVPQLGAHFSDGAKERMNQLMQVGALGWGSMTQAYKG